ncbi:MAG: adenosylmethionine decarboxylase [Anaerolineae bacterium]
MKGFYLRYTALGLLIPFLAFASEPEKREDVSYEFKGIHFLASYSNCDPQALSNHEKLQQVMREAVERSGATILETLSHLFPPNGITMVFLLSESHGSIHTYPEHGACFVDLFTCGSKCSYTKFDETLRNYLKPQKVSAQAFVRGEINQEVCRSQ